MEAVLARRVKEEREAGVVIPSDLDEEVAAVTSAVDRGEDVGELARALGRHHRTIGRISDSVEEAIDGDLDCDDALDEIREVITVTRPRKWKNLL